MDHASGRSILLRAGEVRSRTVEQQRMPEFAEVCLLSFWWRAPAVYWGIICNDRGRFDTRHDSSQISAGVGGKDASTTSSEPHATPQGSHPHAYRGEVLISPKRSAAVVPPHSLVLNHGLRFNARESDSTS